MDRIEKLKNIVNWLNKNYNQNSEMGKIITGKINAFAKQIKY